jgi:hypothetical protein
MSTTTLAACTVAAYLSLNVEVYDDTRGSGLFTFPLVSLNGVIFWLLQLGPHVQRYTHHVARRWDNSQSYVRRYQLHLTLLAIGFRAFCWGVCR